MYLVVSCNTGGSDETPTLVDTGVPHRQRSQGGAVLTVTADRQKGSVKSRVSREEMGTDVEVSDVRGETSHHPRIKGADNGPRKTHRRCLKAPRDDESFAWLGASGTEALLRGQHSEENVCNVLSGSRIYGQTEVGMLGSQSCDSQQY